MKTARAARIPQSPVSVFAWGAGIARRRGVWLALSGIRSFGAPKHASLVLHRAPCLKRDTEMTLI